jgi:uncharacterized membrane protein
MSWKRIKGWSAALLLCAALLPAQAANAAGEITVYTARTHIGVAPGEEVSYSVELINNTDTVQRARLSVQGLPQDWEYSIQSGSFPAKEVAVKPDSSQTINVDVSVPLLVDRGVYPFTISAGNGNTLQLALEVTERGTYETELTADQANIEGHADSTFTYSVELRNRTAETQTYALRSQAEQGWQVFFKVSGERVSSVEVESGETKTISVDVTPPTQIEAGTYTIPIVAETSGTSATLELEASIIGRYGIELTTPSGLLSTDITAGNTRKVELLVRNTGTVELTDVSLSSNTPIDWVVEFEPKEIATIAPGESQSVIASITSSDTALAGDYVVSMTANSPEVDSSATFRVTVKTPVIWGWVGILLIAAVIAGLVYLYRKYGRR